MTNEYTSSPHILVADDDIASHQMLMESLTDFGFVLDVAENGQQAVTIAQQKNPDLILMDITMPVMNGLKACRVLKSNPSFKQTPIIFITAHNDLQNKMQGFEAGGVDYITKPIYPEEVIARITIHLGYTDIKKNLSQRLEMYEQRYGILPTPTEDTDDHDAAELVQQACHLLLHDTTPTLNELVTQLRTNRERLSKSFQIVFGMTPFSWLREERLRQAADMLRYSHKALKVIAFECGYSTSGNFNAAFKQRFGMTPGEFRHDYGDKDKK